MSGRMQHPVLNERDLPVIPVHISRPLDAEDLRQIQHVPSDDWIAAAAAAIDATAAKEQQYLAGTGTDDQAVWQEVLQQHAALFEEVAAARVPLDEVLLHAAEAQDRLDLHLSTQPSDPREVARWAARHSELDLAARALQTMVLERQQAYEKVAQRLLDDLRNALQNRRATEAYRVAGVRREADALRHQAETLYRQAAALEDAAQRTSAALQRLATRIDGDGIVVLEEGAAMLCES